MRNPASMKLPMSDHDPQSMAAGWFGDASDLLDQAARDLRDVRLDADIRQRIATARVNAAVEAVQTGISTLQPPRSADA